MRAALLALAACSAAATPSHRDARCLAVRGCPPGEAVAPCTVSYPEVAVAEAADGADVALRGTLAQGAMRCTLLACPGRCCNDCNGREHLYTGGRLVTLDRTVAGDDSATCFTLGRAGEPVVVTGIVTRAPDASISLAIESICESAE